MYHYHPRTLAVPVIMTPSLIRKVIKMSVPYMSSGYCTLHTTHTGI